MFCLKDLIKLPEKKDELKNLKIDNPIRKFYEGFNSALKQIGDTSVGPDVKKIIDIINEVSEEGNFSFVPSIKRRIAQCLADNIKEIIKKEK